MAEYILNLLPVTEEEKAAFQEAAPRAVHVCAGRRTVTAEQLEQATILFGWPRPADLSRAPRLKWFQSMWAGTDEYLAPGVLPEGVVLTSSAGSNSQSVAEHALACLLALCRRLPQCRDQQRERLWTDPGKMKTLSGATVLVAGAGHIGSWFAGLCRGLGAHTVGLKRDVSRPVEGFDRLAVMEELDGLLPQADVVALMLPHSPQTEGLMDARRLRLMKEDAILLSMGRLRAGSGGAGGRHGGGTPVGRRPGCHGPRAPAPGQPPVDDPQFDHHPPLRGRDAPGGHPGQLRPAGAGQPESLAGWETPGKSGAEIETN